MELPNAWLLNVFIATVNCFSVGTIEEEVDHLIGAEASKLHSKIVTSQ